MKVFIFLIGIMNVLAAINAALVGNTLFVLINGGVAYWLLTSLPNEENDNEKT